MQTDESKLSQARYDAVHRAVLAGLIGNVGLKTDAHEYTGARGTKFNIFPGSGLFKAKPRWVMAAEIVETTKLYARTVARIQPDWIERIAEHLVKRSYTDPHWDPATAHVTAYERVTLYGLPLVERRAVHYGPIDPKQSREIFLLHGLVEGDFAANAPFMRHNRKLIDEIQTLEAKARQRDVLVDARVQYDFYDARVPANIHNGPAFDKWRRQVEQTAPKLLFMQRHDLMRHGAAGVTQDLFPDTIAVNNLSLPLEYHLEPGHPADGVSVRVPLEVLNQLPAERFEWLVPGMLKEKITALIKSLDKPLRVNFVPAPEFAQAAFDALKPGQGSLYAALAQFLSKAKGVTVRPTDFDPGSLLDHLHMNFKIVDPAGKQVAMGRDLEALRRQLGITAKETFAETTPSEYHRDNLTRWDFGDLPEQVEVRRHGMTLAGYPALVDKGDSVALRLLDSPENARISMRQGLRRLFMVQLREEMKYLSRNLPGIERMAMNYASLGSAQDLKDQIIDVVSDQALSEASMNVRTAEQFADLAKEGWQRLKTAANTVTGSVGEILQAYQSIAEQLSRRYPPALEPSIADIREQLRHLMPRDFLRKTPPAWLPHLPRFLKGISVRLQKLTNAGLSRDTAQMAQVTPAWQRYLDRRKKHTAAGITDPELEQYRWMIEELRVSLFAQELKTSIPISPQRLEKQWEKVRP